jgi:hypothetical protein
MISALLGKHLQRFSSPPSKGRREIKGTVLHVQINMKSLPARGMQRLQAGIEKIWNTWSEEVVSRMDLLFVWMDLRLFFISSEWIFIFV